MMTGKKNPLSPPNTRARRFFFQAPLPCCGFPFLLKMVSFFFFCFCLSRGHGATTTTTNLPLPPQTPQNTPPPKKKRRRGSHSCFFNFLILSLLSFSKWRIGSVSFYEEQSGGKGGGGTGRARAWAEHTNTHFLFSSLAAALVQKWKKEKGNENS